MGAKTRIEIEVREACAETKRMDVSGAMSAGEIVEVIVSGLSGRVTLEQANAGLILRVIGDRQPPAMPFAWPDCAVPQTLAKAEEWTEESDGRLRTELNLATVQALAEISHVPLPPPPTPPNPPGRRTPPPPPLPPLPVTANGSRSATMLLEYRDSDTAQTLFGEAAVTLRPWPPDGRTANLLDLATGRVYSKEEADALLAEKADKTALAGKADLVDGKVPSAQLPSYVDDVLEYASVSAFPATGEAGKIYVATDENKTYRWSGTQYVQIGGDDPPVTSVNGKTGAVVLAASDVGAASEADFDALLSVALYTPLQDGTIFRNGSPLPQNVKLSVQGRGPLAFASDIPPADTNNPAMDGAGSAGRATTYARGDHQHPTDTTRMAATATGNDIEVGGEMWSGATIRQFAEIIAGEVKLRSELTNIAPPYDSTQNYNPGELATYTDWLYVCKSQTTGPWKSSDWIKTSVSSALSGKQDTISDLATIRSGAAAGATAVQPSALSAYRTATAQDAIDSAQDTAIAAKYTKPATGIPASDLAPGVIPSVPSASDADPLMDGTASPGVSPDFARSDHTHPTDTTRAAVSDLNLALSAVSATDAASTAALTDRTITSIDVAASVGSLALSFPAPVAGRARDFSARLLCRGSGLSTIALPSGEIVEFGSDAIAGVCDKAGVHLVRFAEIAAGRWSVSASSEEPVAVDWVGFTGTQFVDTGLAPENNTLDFYVKLSNGQTESSFQPALGCRQTLDAYTTASYAMFFRYGSSNQIRIDIANKGSATYAPAMLDDPISIEWDSATKTLTRTRIASGVVNTYTANQKDACDYSFVLGGVNTAGTIATGAKLRLYSATFSRAGTPLLDLSPVRIGSSGFLLDSISGSLYGSGDLVVGPDKNA